MLRESVIDSEGELKVSFGYQWNGHNGDSYMIPNGYKTSAGAKLPRNSSFTCLSGAALSANATLANTNICNGVIGAEILPSWDSPNSFRKVPSSPCLSRMDILSSSSLQSSMSNLSCSPSSPSPLDYDYNPFQSMSAPFRSESFLNAMEVQVAGGAAGEDRVQAVCSEENGWLFCAIYDGFNGRDAADFLAGTLYENIIFHTNFLDCESKEDISKASNGLYQNGCFLYALEDGNKNFGGINPSGTCNDMNIDRKLDVSSDSYRQRVLDSLLHALNQSENEFLCMVEQEMDDRPDLVSVGSCVLVAFLHEMNLYTLNLGDSRAVLATFDQGGSVKNGYGCLKPVQLTESHTVDDEVEKTRLLCEHPDDPTTILGGKVKGKLKVTRAFGVGYLKKEKLNDALMGILRVRNLISPPYISTDPSMNVHKISKSDHFVILGSDGLFDFFSNDEAVQLVHSYISRNPSGDPAKFLLEQLVERAADCAGFSTEELMNVPAGRRRKYHDDVTVIVIILGTNQRTTKASTNM